MVLWMSYVCIVTRQFTDAAGGLNVEAGTADATGSVLATELSGVAGKMDFTWVKIACLSPRTASPQVSRFSGVNESTVCSVIWFSTNSLAFQILSLEC